MPATSRGFLRYVRAFSASFERLGIARMDLKSTKAHWIFSSIIRWAFFVQSFPSLLASESCLTTSIVLPLRSLRLPAYAIQYASVFGDTVYIHGNYLLGKDSLCAFHRRRIPGIAENRQKKMRFGFKKV